MGDFNKQLDLSDLGIDTGEEYQPLDKFEVVPINSNASQQEQELDEDYSLARKQLNASAQMGMEALKVALENMRNSESPRQAEVFSNLLGQLSGINSDIIKHHESYKKAKGVGNEGGSNNTMNVNGNVVFSGSEYELDELMNEAEEREEKEVNPKKD